MKNKLLFVQIIMITLINCSFNYEEAMVEGDLSQKVPKTVLYNFEQVRVSKDAIIKISAVKAENFNQLQKLVIAGFSFSEQDKSGRVKTTGQADNLVFFTDTEDAEINGNISLVSAQEGASIGATSLKWASSDKILSSDEENTVTITKKDGSCVEGYGFKVDVRRRIISFMGSVQGQYEYE